MSRVVTRGVLSDSTVGVHLVVNVLGVLLCAAPTEVRQAIASKERTMEANSYVTPCCVINGHNTDTIRDPEVRILKPCQREVKAWQQSEWSCTLKEEEASQMGVQIPGRGNGHQKLIEDWRVAAVGLAGERSCGR